MEREVLEAQYGWRRRPCLLHVWEHGTMGAVMDGQGVLPALPEYPVHPGPMPPEPRSRSRTPVPTRTPLRERGPAIFKKQVGPRPSAQASEDRRQALQKWLRIVAAACLNQAALDEDSLTDILVNKATGTLHLRANAILAYEKWARKTKAQAFPFSEAVAYDYVRHLDSSGSAPTKASGFRQAVAFTGGLFKAEGASSVVESSRVAGSSQSSYLRKRPTKQAKAFPAAGVSAMEAVVSDTSGSSGFGWEERVFLGFMLFVIHTRARFADAARVTTEPWLDLDSTGSGFVEVGATELKTGRGRARLRRVLPLVGHARGLTDVPWAASWLTLRADVGLDAGADSTLMPIPLVGGGFGCSRMLSSEGCAWLRELLPRIYSSFGDVSLYGTHSAKATLLSWMAKSGCSDHDRRMLGGHAKKDDTSLLEYSRDALAGPLLRLQRVLRLVANGVFNPDETRSGRWHSQEVALGIDVRATGEPLGEFTATSSARRECPACAEEVDGLGDIATCASCERLCHSGPCCNECPACAMLVCSQCLSLKHHECVPGQEVPDHVEVDSTSDSSDESASSEGRSEDDMSATSTEDDEGASETSALPAIPEGGLWLSRRTGVAHVASARKESLTACGLQMSPLDMERRWSWPRRSLQCRHRGCLSAMRPS
jgi:hypothetical protein